MDFFQLKNPAQLFEKHALLRVVSHVAHGAKHFKVDPNRHSSGDAATRQTYAENYANNYGDDSLFIYSSAKEASELGKPEYNLLELGGLPIHFWRRHVYGDGLC